MLGLVLGTFGYYAVSERSDIGVQAKISPGPPLGFTGAPGEGNCTGCHYTYELNSGSGKIQITGLPANYVLGQTYPVTVTVTHPTARRWGFELTAIDANGVSSTIGGFNLTDSTNTDRRSTTISGQSRTYVHHTGSGTFPGQAGSASWSFTWTAPASNVGVITFYAAGNAANNQVSPEGDYIYTTSVVVNAPLSNQPPTFAAMADRIVGVGDRISFTVSATDPNGDPIALSASPLSNATFDPASGRFTFTPVANQVGLHQVTFTASDGQAQTQQTINFQVLNEGSQALAGLSKTTGTSNYLDWSGATALDLTALGTFDEGARIIFNGLEVTTQPVTGGLVATLPASELAHPGAYVVRVRLGNGTLTNARILALASVINPQRAATVDAASYSATVAPGQIVALFGTELIVGSGTAAATSIPLPRSLQATSVYVNGIVAPLYFTSAGQINYQLPYSTATGEAAVVVLRDDGVASYGVVSVSDTAPAIFTANFSGSGQAVAQNSDFSLNGDPAANPQSKRARKGDFVILYGTGTGAQLINPSTGQPLIVNDGETATSNPLMATSTSPTVTIGGKAAAVYFSGLAPGFVGLWQLNIQVPNDAPSGASVELTVSLGNRTARTVTIAIE